MAALSAAEIRFLLVVVFCSALVVAFCSAPEMQQTPTTAMPRIKARYLIFIEVIRFCVVANTPVCDFPARKESHVLWKARSGLYAFASSVLAARMVKPIFATPLRDLVEAES